MKNDYEVKLYMSERRKGLTQKQAAARAGMSERTARKYEQAGVLPSSLDRNMLYADGAFKLAQGLAHSQAISYTHS